jgi:uroporphyrinogen decarboxylase
MLKNDLLLRAARGEETERTPVWLMRQAGRILAEYREVRKKAGSFVNLVKSPEMAAEVTIQPVDILGVDAAIIFSDILVVPDAMGLPYEVVENVGPVFKNTISHEEDLKKLRKVDPEEHMGYVLDAIKLTKKELNGRVPLIGFAGAPWTIFTYMIEGKGSKTFSRARGLLYSHPRFSMQLLDDITNATIDYLRAQINAGADLVQVFDSWAGILPPEHYHEFALPCLKRICESIDQVPITVFAKGANYSLKELAELDCQTLGLDWQLDPESVREQVGNTITLQGNLDPCALYGSYEDIRKHTKTMLQRFGPSRHIANLGHGVYPDTDPDKVRCFVDCVKEFDRISSTG